jgi:hypothetical protein
MVYKNFEKNYNTYRMTWSSDAELEEPELDASTVSTQAAAIAARQAAAAVAAVVAEATIAHAATTTTTKQMKQWLLHH